MSLPTLGVFLGVSAFAGSHFALSHPPVRERLVARLGADRFKAAYSIVAAATLLPTALLYTRYGRGAGPRLYGTSSRIQRTLGFGFKTLGAITFSQAVMQPNAISDNMVSKKDKLTDKDIKVEGIYRVSRHATFMSFALLGVGNILTRGHLADVIFWSMFPIVWVTGSMHQDERLKQRYPASYFENTSLWPGQAILSGKQSWKDAVAEMSPKAIAVALIAPFFFL